MIIHNVQFCLINCIMYLVVDAIKITCDAKSISAIKGPGRCKLKTSINPIGLLRYTLLHKCLAHYIGVKGVEDLGFSEV